ncbi:MAG: hypothetical protein ACTSQ4_02155 [Candidatus Heimdallarchaeaceae archaeon]
MTILQKFNKKTNAWVKFRITSKGSVIQNVKQRRPAVPFKGVKIKRR